LQEIEKKRKQLIFRSNHRGTKEMDLLLGSFANQHVPDFDASDLAIFEQLLEENDPNLYNWISGREEAPANVVSDVFKKLCAHKYC